LELEALEEVGAEISAAGGTLGGISPPREQYLQQVVKRDQLRFDVLRDKGNQLASEFGLVFTLPDDLRELYSKYGIDLERFNGDDSRRLPIPGRFIIDPNRLIRYASVDPNYTVRPEPTETVAVLHSLREKHC